MIWTESTNRSDVHTLTLHIRRRIRLYRGRRLLPRQSQRQRRKLLQTQLLNAGKVTQEFYLVEGNESTIAVNVVNTFLLALLMLPKLRQAAEEY